MNKLWWILGGVALTAGVFFIPDQSGHIWTPLVYSMIAVGIFYLALVVYIFRKSRSTFDRVFCIGVLALITAITVQSGTYQHKVSDWQLDHLLDIRKTIDQGILLTHIHEPLLQTLHAYHEESRGSEVSAGELFEEQYGSHIQKIEGLPRFIPDPEKEERFEESPHIFVQKADSRDSVILIGQSTITQGRDSTFKNYNGQKGKMQYRGILTSKGVDYEREN